MKCVINCSSDRIQLRYADMYEELSHKGLEYIWPDKFLVIMRDYEIDCIYLINGPGSFTTLRVVCLTINAYISATGSTTIQLYSTTKTQLFKTLLRHSGITSMMIYIGQRINMRQYHFDSDQYEVVPKGSVTGLYDDISSDYIDGVSLCRLGVRDDMITLHVGGDVYMCSLHDIMNPVDRFDPHYMIQPNISTPQR